MAKDAILAVKEAEDKARQLLDDARDTSKKLKEESVIKGENEFNRILEEGRVEAENIKNSAKEEGQALASPILEDGEKKAKRLGDLDPNRRDKAVNFIIERIVSSNGYS